MVMKKILSAVCLVVVLIIALLVAIAEYMKPKVGSRYVYINECDFRPNPFAEPPVPFVKIYTVIEIRGGYCRCMVASITADGKPAYYEDTAMFEELQGAVRISR